ncbi:MAG: GIY-YIG nuclease family protein [Thermoanaerobaculaceae bacterium]|jgi:predicted GIY-YIG superfamily endonuclease
MKPVTFSALPRLMPDRGIYLFSEKGKHLYVGRSNHLRQRLQGHCRLSGSHFKATFAFLIARHRTRQTRATYQSAGSRMALTKDKTFARQFAAAKRRVARMEIRFVEETDATRQALLEIYAAVALGTRYNDFDTH